MFKIIDNLKTYSFKGTPMFAANKKFIKVPPNSLSKYQAVIIKIDGKFFALENVTIICKNEIIDFVSTKPIQFLEKRNKIKKQIVKKLYRIKKELSNKFLYGLSDNELELLSDINNVYQKYKLLKIHKLNIIPERLIKNV